MPLPADPVWWWAPAGSGDGVPGNCETDGCWAREGGGEVVLRFVGSVLLALLALLSLPSLAAWGRRGPVPSSLE